LNLKVKLIAIRAANNYPVFDDPFFAFVTRYLMRAEKFAPAEKGAPGSVTYSFSQKKR